MICYKINDTQTECCNPMSDTCTISGEGPFPTGPVGVNTQALRELVDKIILGFKNLMAGKGSKETVRKPETK